MRLSHNSLRLPGRDARVLSTAGKRTETVSLIWHLGPTSATIRMLKRGDAVDVTCTESVAVNFVPSMGCAAPAPARCTRGLYTYCSSRGGFGRRLRLGIDQPLATLGAAHIRCRQAFHVLLGVVVDLKSVAFPAILGVEA
jgi:hypothetical protein